MGISNTRQRRLTIAICIALGWSAGPAFALCRDDKVSLRGDWGQAQFTVSVVDTNETRAQGLMHVENLPQSQGMLFMYERPQRLVFWMKNTLIPLDMLFLDARGVVQHIHSNAVPLDLTPIDGGQGRLAVLEINGGMAQSMGITVGSQLRHPAFSQETAIWPCKE